MMKQALLIFLGASMTFCAIAQDNPTRQGRWLGDVQFGFNSADLTMSHSSYTDDINLTHSAIDAGFSVGYTVMDNLSIGLEYFVNQSSEDQEFPDITGLPGSANAQTTETSSHIIGLAARYFFLENNVKPFAGVAAGPSFTSRNSSGAGLNTEDSGGGFGYVVQAGLCYFINDAVGFELSYDFFNASSSLEGSGDSAGFEFDYTLDETIKTSTITAGVIIAL